MGKKQVQNVPGVYTSGAKGEMFAQGTQRI